MIKEFRQSARRQFVALLLCAIFGLGLIGLGERNESEASGNGSVYQAEFLRPDQPHNGQDRGDESDTINVNAPSLYVTNTTAGVVNYRPGSLTPIAAPFGPSVYWLPLG
jgi:hypothetical protein